MPTITIPNQWRPRDYQLPLWNFLENGGRRAVAVWHRRAGKDSLGLNFTVTQALQRPGNYWHMLPTATQGRRVVWEAIDKHGRRVIDQAFPPEIRDSAKPQRDDEMLIRLRNGSTIQVLGSDRFDSNVGSNPVGVIFSEWSLTDPRAWEFLRPILRENGGYAVFIYTPRGRNHGYTMFDMARTNDDWFCQILSTDDTDVLTEADIDADRREGMSDEMIAQEYHCSFEAPLEGSYYAAQMTKAEKDGRIGDVPHDPNLLVETWWDLGRSDDTAVWFMQRSAGSYRAINYYAAHGHFIDHYANKLDEMKDEHGYRYGDMILPHDGKSQTLMAANSCDEFLIDAGYDQTIVMPQEKINKGIQQVRRILPMTVFDKTLCADGIAALRSYRKETEPEKYWPAPNKPLYKDHPLHDWASHPADAFRTGALHTPSVHRGPMDIPANHISRGVV